MKTYTLKNTNNFNDSIEIDSENYNYVTIKHYINANAATVLIQTDSLVNGYFCVCAAQSSQVLNITHELTQKINKKVKFTYLTDADVPVDPADNDIILIFQFHN